LLGPRFSPFFFAASGYQPRLHRRAPPYSGSSARRGQGKVSPPGPIERDRSSHADSSRDFARKENRGSTISLMTEVGEEGHIPLLLGAKAEMKPAQFRALPQLSHCRKERLQTRDGSTTAKKRRVRGRRTGGSEERAEVEKAEPDTLSSEDRRGSLVKTCIGRCRTEDAPCLVFGRGRGAGGQDL